MDASGSRLSLNAIIEPYKKEILDLSERQEVTISDSLLFGRSGLSLARSHKINFKLKHRFPNIAYLDLSYTSIADLSFIKFFPNLRVLNLTGCIYLSSLKPLAEIKNLEVLLLEKTFIKNISAVTHLNLRYLSLWGSHHIENIKRITRIKTLEYLNLGNTNMDSPPKLHALNNLKELILSFNNLNDSELSLPRQLQSLYISNASLEDPTFILELRNLRLLDISVNPLDSIPIPLENINSINISYTHISDLSFLKRAKNLEVLYARSTNIDSIDGLPKTLRKLDIAYTLVEDLSPLRNMINLETLDISGLYIENLDFLKDMPKLKRLYLENAYVLDWSGLEKLLLNKTIEFIHLAGTEVPPRVLQLLRKTRIFNILYDNSG